MNVKNKLLPGLCLIALAGASMGADSCAGTTDEPATTQNTTTTGTQEKTATQEEPAMTSSQKRAVESAQQYLELSGMSKRGLIRQLSSSAGEGFSRADAVFAANHVDVDWNKEAVQAARQYLDISPMSKSALIHQLSASAGDGFTRAQAIYAANKVY